jgi:hypothetical protein
MSRVARADHPVDVARPFAWVATFAFAAGFWGYMACAHLGGR